MRRPLSLVFALVALASSSLAASFQEYAERVAPLIAPTKLATLSDRAANPRVQKYVYWLAVATQDSHDAEQVGAEAVRLAGYTNKLAAKLTAEAMVRNLTIAERLGCINALGLEDMRRGQSPTIQSGPYAGDELSVDHIIPMAVCYELRSTIANLELMPLKMNIRKRDAISQRQVDLAKKWNAAGLLSSAGLKAVLAREVFRAQDDQLYSESTHTTGAQPSVVTSPAPKSVPSLRERSDKDPPQALTHWITASSGKRHNSSCRYYKNSKGGPCGPNEGIACKLCGG